MDQPLTWGNYLVYKGACALVAVALLVILHLLTPPRRGP